MQKRPLGRREQGHSTRVSASRHTDATKRKKPAEGVLEPLQGKEISFTVYGEPVAKGRPRFSSGGNTYTPKKTKNAESIIAVLYKQKYGRHGFEKGVPLCAEITFFMKIAESDTKKTKMAKILGKLRPTKKPDIENMAKTVFDALNKVAYYDDSQIVDAVLRKVWSEKARTEIVIREADQDG